MLNVEWKWKMLLTTAQNKQQENQESKQKHDKLKKQTNRQERKAQHGNK